MKCAGSTGSRVWGIRVCVSVCLCACMCAHAVEQLVHVITKLNAAPSLSMVLNLQPEVPKVCCRLPRPVKEYRLFVIGCVTTAKQGEKKKKRFGGWNVMWTVGFNHWTPQGCYRLPPMLLKAKGWFRASGFCCYFTWPCEWPQFPQSAERDGIY